MNCRQLTTTILSIAICYNNNFFSVTASPKWRALKDYALTFAYYKRWEGRLPLKKRGIACLHKCCNWKIGVCAYLPVYGRTYVVRVLASVLECMRSCMCELSCVHVNDTNQTINGLNKYSAFRRTIAAIIKGKHRQVRPLGWNFLYGIKAVIESRRVVTQNVLSCHCVVIVRPALTNTGRNVKIGSYT